MSRRRAAWLSGFLVLSLGLCATRLQADMDGGFPVITLISRDQGSQWIDAFFRDDALEHLTGNSGSWCAVVEMDAYPGEAYDLRIWHRADPYRLKVYLLDRNPLDPASTHWPSLRSELLLSRVGTWTGAYHRPYGRSSDGPEAVDARIELPAFFDTRSVYLVFEWRAVGGGHPYEPLLVDVRTDRDVRTDWQFPQTGWMGRGRPPNLLGRPFGDFQNPRGFGALSPRCPHCLTE